MQVEFGILQRWLVGGIHYKGSAMFLIRIQGNHIWASSGRTYLYQLCSFPAQCICLQMVLELFCMICSSVITFLTSYCVLVQSLILWNKLFAPTFLLSLLSSAWLPLAERRFEHQVEWRFLCPQVSLCFWCDYIRNILSQWCHTEVGVDGGSTACHTKQDQTHQKLNCSRQPPQCWRSLGARLWRHPSVSRIRSYPLAARRILSNHKENNKRNKSKCRLMLFLLHTHSNLQPCNLTSVFFTHSRTQAK